MEPAPFQTQSTIQQTLSEHGLAPNRRLGQNFLIDRNLMQKLVEAADLGSGTLVLEVGGGTGGLTDQLATRADQLIVAEADAGLARLLTARFEGHGNVEIIHTDILERKHDIAPTVVEKLRSHGDLDRFLLVANLPYSIASPLLINLLTLKPTVERMVFTIQKEVADRVVADAGSKDFGPLSIALQIACDVEILAKLPPSVFWPPPKIDSSMLRLDVKKEITQSPDALRAFLTVVRTAFAHRRKTLRSNIASLPANINEIIVPLFDVTLRAEQIPLKRWEALLTSMIQNS
ncbi:MAG: ribosomal RNA small subunit methyltransferase A [Phycisphaerae bacterium]|nr:MAG: ribosomal RNA small subunit methyltransferase A [Phycisphaerae bacterium]